MRLVFIRIPHIKRVYRIFDICCIHPSTYIYANSINVYTYYIYKYIYMIICLHKYSIPTVILYGFMVFFFII